MRVLKIELEGTTTSFRHPHLLTGRQPSYPLPPPATLYGHIASVLGDYPAPESFRFAFAFTHQGSVDDYEHTWLIERDDRKEKAGQPAPNITGTLSPTVREVFFRPHLTLYLDTPHLGAWHAAFRAPAFPVALGRSQDLAAYTRVEVITLEERQAGYLDHTLLPWSWRPEVSLGQGLLMPRVIDPRDRQRVVWARYVALTHRAYLPMAGESGREAHWVRIEPGSRSVWVDPHTPEYRDRQRALVWHTLTGADSESLDVPA